MKLEGFSEYVYFCVCLWLTHFEESPLEKRRKREGSSRNVETIWQKRKKADMETLRRGGQEEKYSLKFA